MSHFYYKNDSLYSENVRVERIIKEHGTPCYIYSWKAFTEQFRLVQEAFAAVNPLVCFAMKANSSLAVVRTLVEEGAGCDIVSGGELAKALKAKADPRKIVFASVGKTAEEIRDAIQAGILFFNVESRPELEEIDRIARALRKRAPVTLRVNPDVQAVTHDRIVTGTLDKKFGLDLQTAGHIFRDRKQYAGLDILGVHMHIGSQIKTVKPYIEAMNRLIPFLDDLRRDSVQLEYFDLGGGFGISYDEDHPEHIEYFAKELIPLLKQTGLKIVIEPGRFIAGNSGIFVTRVLYVKDNGVKKFIIVDGGMNDLPRPSLYDAHHDIVPVKKKSPQETGTFDVVGPICESGDFFAKKRVMPVVGKGDLLAIKSAGAYCYVMGSNYNVRGRAPEVLVKGKQYAVIRKRETLKDLMRGETIPDFVGKRHQRNFKK